MPHAPPGPSARRTLPKPGMALPSGPPLELFNTRMVELAELSLKKTAALKSSDVAIRAASCPFAPSAHTPESKPSSLSSKKNELLKPLLLARAPRTPMDPALCTPKPSIPSPFSPEAAEIPMPYWPELVAEIAEENESPLLLTESVGPDSLGPETLVTPSMIWPAVKVFEAPSWA